MATTIHSHKEQPRLRDQEGKYLTFALANEEYGLEILKVREIGTVIAATRSDASPYLDSLALDQ